MNDTDQRYFDNQIQTLNERLSKIERMLAILLERTKPTIESYS